MIGLTDQQQEAVLCSSDLVLTACPGSGKTRTLIAKLVFEIENVRGSPRSIACITYTNTAVQEMEQRAAEQLQPGDSAHYCVSTIHSFCLSDVVRPYGWLLPDIAPSSAILTQDNPVFDEIAAYAAEKINYFGLTQADREAFESLSVDSRGNIIGLAAQNAAVCQAAPYFWQRCAELKYMDFGTIIFTAYRLLRKYPSIANSLCSKYAWFLVDEFQDTTELQIEILKILHATGRSRIFAVGDLAQSIYGFTGAKPELVEPFAEGIGARTDLSLSENFRSSQHIVDHAERLFPRTPSMTANGPDKACQIAPALVRDTTTFEAITEYFLPSLYENRIGLGDATILAKDWASLIRLSRQLRDFGTPVVGPGARPYRRSRLFAGLAEQLCGAISDPHAESGRQLERALFHAIQDVTRGTRFDVFSHAGRVTLIRLMKEATRLADEPGALRWLDAMAQATGAILVEAGYVDREQAGMFYASVQEMKADMQRQSIDMANLAISDLGLFASPRRALRLSTIHYAKGREYKAVALIGLRRGTFPHFRSTDVEAEKRLFYVGVTRAEKLLMYVAERDNWGNPPSIFLGSGGVAVV